ncbi:MAG: response regulator [Anaerolineae bacterium]
MSTTLPLITVTVVNDQVAICKLWQQLIDRTPGLTCPGYATSGDESIQLVNAVEPDVVLMDVLMPGMRGDEAMYHIKASHPDTIVIMYSADASTEPIARRAGAADFLLMPVPPTQLALTIRRIYGEVHGYG